MKDRASAGDWFVMELNAFFNECVDTCMREELMILLASNSQALEMLAAILQSDEKAVSGDTSL